MPVVPGLVVSDALFHFVEHEGLAGTDIAPADFWSGVAEIVATIGPRIAAHVEQRATLQAEIDRWHQAHPGQPDPISYEAFLRQIGYLVDPPTDFQITTSNTDPEVAVVAGPQLVVPLLNARFALNAANARWGSLYDALYGTDAVPRDGDLAPGAQYNPVRGAEVVKRGRALLDKIAPLLVGNTSVSHSAAVAYTVDDAGLAVTLAAAPDQATARLADSAAFAGYTSDAASPASILLVHNGLHVEIVIDRQGQIGADDPAGVQDVVLESAITTIMDLEDSVAAVDAADKVLGYRNWLQLMQGTLTAEVDKAGTGFTRRLNPDRKYLAPDGTDLTLPGRSVLFIRQVGHLMTTDAITDQDGQPISEGIADAIFTAVGFLHDGTGSVRNSRAGSMYVVKPKMHGPQEVSTTVDLLGMVEKLLHLPPNTIKLGIMDEERRTTLNLAACIAAAADRVVFINTGFLDRTGDEMHTDMHAGPMVRKADMRSATWISAYEKANVDTGLAAGFVGRAQIGKGMWAEPDSMAAMVDQKIGHPQAGASCAWVPSPTAATLHAMHYHDVKVAAVQQELTGQQRSTLGELLTIPIGDPATWTPADRQAELDNNLQGILGYVVRWVDAGVGCSKVPDIRGVGLMEDRATCRISSQHVANWLLHGVVTLDDVEASLRRMAAVVDEQNSSAPGYLPMAPKFDGPAFAAARELVLEGLHQPSGYTEPILHRYRRQVKSAGA